MLTSRVEVPRVTKVRARRADEAVIGVLRVTHGIERDTETNIDHRNLIEVPRRTAVERVADLIDRISLQEQYLGVSFMNGLTGGSRQWRIAKGQTHIRRIAQ